LMIGLDSIIVCYRSSKIFIGLKIIPYLE